MPPPSVRQLRTANVEELAAAQPDKNRRYVQLQPGRLTGELVDARLGNVQIFRERLSAGMIVEAAPPAQLVPFGVVLSSRGPIRFCGDDFCATTLAQATAGTWDIRFAGPLDYVSCVFERSWFDREASALLGHAPPKHWFRNGSQPSSLATIRQLGLTIAQTLRRLQHDASSIEPDRIRRTVEAEVLRLTVATLTSHDATAAPLESAARRHRAIRRAIGYVMDHPDAETTVSALCRIGEVSERTLEYGFREHLDTTPQRFLRVVRLNGARRDLLRPRRTGVTVTDVALRWGFVELGRFAGEYRRFFGELPSETLRRA